MKVERGEFSVEVQHGKIVLDGQEVIDADTARWLAFVALPTALAVLSDAPGTVKDDESTDEQIPGQTSIDEALAG